MKFASLGSGSEGNALLISTQSGTTSTTVMLDCGFGIRETERRLERLQMTPADLAGIIVTHEHQDHVGGVFKFARRHRLPVWLTFGTYQATRDRCDDVDIHFCRDGGIFSIGDLELSPYTVPHDAREPVQYVASNGALRLGVLTDAGHATAHLITELAACDALMLECNHDRQMLRDSTYPPSLKQRIGGDYGHLSNQTASEILSELDKSRLKRIVGAHLSLKNNTPELARTALTDVVADSVDVMIACQEEGFFWVNVADR
ncbi:MBL fold metallo-hydrolase [Herminiimonas fonticola]|uniref:Phosphoribosyl 1,2-cyclic phosphodiesterase n=1 Tax=Herminiimonas fonticola TaxID=303380 RepID=A0A4V3BWI3_9BURK|nr:MBL fold metallo-hydrolase [Herminiimonas fonticola]RBA25607.1 Metal-dependent hydrolases of the beta-lactamase superfamily I [Herminiimonas fonticola]TDN94718.1 phosphoribosyl 1,2-cyclic phosphodiesterase [Herminiimonas fonticola]